MSTAIDIRKKFFSQIEKASFYNIFEQLSKFIIYKDAKMWLVGGQIRDYYLQANLKSNDIDLAINCNARELFEYLKYNSSLKNIRYFEKFHTLSIKINGLNIDIAQLRLENYLKGSFVPKINYIDNIIDDLQRRDFTMNSMALNLLDFSKMNIIDPYNGIADIKDKQLRVIHPKSYVDDPTRIFRAARYISRLNLTISKTEESLIKEAVKYLPSLPQYFINKEIDLVNSDKNPKEAVKLLNHWGCVLEE